MPRADQRLYAALLRVGRKFVSERIPLLGVAGSEVVCCNLAWRHALRAAVESPPPGAGLAEGARLLTLLQHQLEMLLQSEEHTREALAEWAMLADRFAWSRSSSGSSSRGSSSSSSSSSSSNSSALPGGLWGAAAAEEGLALLSRQACQLADPLWELEDEALEATGAASSSSSSSSQEPAALSLDDLAAAVRQQHPSLFSSSSGAGGSASSLGSPGSWGSGDGAACRDQQVEQAAALADVLYRQQRFKFEPFEWVYEGLSPLLLPRRLERRKLAPLTLAVLAAGVGRRLGMRLLPVPAEGLFGEHIAAAVVEGPAGGAAGAAMGALPLEQLRPDVAQRYAGRAGAAAPAAEPWVLLLDASSCCSSSGGSASCAASQQRAAEGERPQQWAWVMDACTGQVLDAEGEAQRKFPELQLSLDWQLLAPLVGWQHMVRTIIQAHQRRGESDLVAHWLYVLLALDTQAPEWQHMLASSPLQMTGN